MQVERSKPTGKWFVLGPDGPVGPVTIDQLRRGLVAGKVPSDSMVAPEGSPAWSPIGEVLDEIARRERAEVESIFGAPAPPVAPRPSGSIAPRPPTRPSSASRAPEPRSSASVAPRPSREVAARPSPASAASSPAVSVAPPARSSSSKPAVVAPAPKAPVSVKNTDDIAAPPADAEVLSAADLGVDDDTATPSLPSVTAATGTTATTATTIEELDRPRSARRSDIVVPPPMPVAAPARSDRRSSTPPGAPVDGGAASPDAIATPVAHTDAPAAAPSAGARPAPAPAPAVSSVQTSLLTRGPLIFSALTTVLVAAAAYRVWVPPRVNPSAIVADAAHVLELHEGAKRAAACESSLADRDDLAKGKPYLVEHTAVADICRVVSKGRPGTALHGGFVLVPAAECARLEANLPRDLARHEAGLRATIAATCGPNETPTSASDDSTKLAAQGALATVLPQLVRDSAAGQLSPSIRACYDDVVRNGAATAREERRLRCAVLRGRTQGAAPLPATTVLRRSGLLRAYEAYGRDHADTLASLRTQEREGDFLESFLQHAETQACAESGSAENNTDTRLRLSSLALASCLGAATSLLDRAPDAM